MENKVTGFRRVFNPDQKCDDCRRIYADVPLFMTFFKDGTSKITHADCQKPQK
jgi:hypothetical protein